MAPSTASRVMDVSAKEQEEMADVYRKLREAEAKLVGLDGKTETLPNNLYSFLLRLLADLRAGHAVTLLQNRHELTTVEASRILGMSRQYLVQLLEKAAIPYHMVGTHRRLYARDVMAFKAQRDASRRQTLDELARREFATGGYGKVPHDFHSGK